MYKSLAIVLAISVSASASPYSWNENIDQIVLKNTPILAVSQCVDPKITLTESYENSEKVYAAIATASLEVSICKKNVVDIKEPVLDGAHDSFTLPIKAYTAARFYKESIPIKFNFAQKVENSNSDLNKYSDYNFNEKDLKIISDLKKKAKESCELHRVYLLQQMREYALSNPQDSGCD